MAAPSDKIVALHFHGGLICIDEAEPIGQQEGHQASDNASFWSPLTIGGKPYLKLAVKQFRKNDLPLHTFVEIPLAKCGDLYCTLDDVRNGAGDLAQDLEFWTDKDFAFPGKRILNPKTQQRYPAKQKYINIHLEYVPEKIRWQGAEIKDPESPAASYKASIDECSKTSGPLQCLMIIDSKVPLKDLEQWVELCNNVEPEYDDLESPTSDNAETTDHGPETPITDQESVKQQEEEAKDSKEGSPAKKQKTKDQHNENRKAMFAKIQEMQELMKGLTSLDITTDKQMRDVAKYWNANNGEVHNLSEKLEDEIPSPPEKE